MGDVERITVRREEKGARGGARSEETECGDAGGDGACKHSNRVKYKRITTPGGPINRNLFRYVVGQDKLSRYRVGLREYSLRAVCRDQENHRCGCNERPGSTHKRLSPVCLLLGAKSLSMKDEQCESGGYFSHEPKNAS
jgi:hypothetical protein